LTLKGKEEDSTDEESAITVTQASNMASHLQCLIMTKKDILGCTLDSTGIVQEFTEKLILM
jgi:hypothetical protein